MNGQSTSIEPNVYQKDNTCSIDKHERGPDSADRAHTTMARKGFTNDDVLVICADVARTENIFVVVENAANSNHITSVSEHKKESSISQRFKSVKVALSKRNSAKLLDSEDIGDIQHNSEAVPGLHGRDIVAVAILVGEDGVRTKSYTENDEIPSDEMEAAGNVFLTRVPVNVEKGKEDVVKENKDPNAKSVADILSDELDANIRKKLIKRMEKVLIRLHTTDLNTARSFLKSERYANVRKAIKSELISFITKDMKLVIAHNA